MFVCACIQISAYISNKKNFPYYFEFKLFSSCKSDCNLVFSKGSGRFVRVICWVLCNFLSRTPV